jgi:hypothetical protein
MEWGDTFWRKRIRRTLNCAAQSVAKRKISRITSMARSIMRGTDNKNIRDTDRLTAEEGVNIVRTKLANYKLRMVKRV